MKIHRGGFPDMRVLNLTFNDTPVSLHYIMRYTNDEPQLLFVLREIDTKLLRKSADSVLGTQGRTEQCIRTVVNLISKSDHIWATSDELKALKCLGLVTKRGPRAALIASKTFISLLWYFGCDFYAMVFESILLCLEAERKVLRDTLRALDNAIYNANRKFNIPAGDDITYNLLLKQRTDLGTTYPPSHKHFFPKGAPILDAAAATILSFTMHIPTTKSVLWGAMSAPEEIDPNDIPDNIDPLAEGGDAEQTTTSVKPSTSKKAPRFTKQRAKQILQQQRLKQLQQQQHQKELIARQIGESDHSSCLHMTPEPHDPPCPFAPTDSTCGQVSTQNASTTAEMTDDQIKSPPSHQQYQNTASSTHPVNTDASTGSTGSTSSTDTRIMPLIKQEIVSSSSPSSQFLEDNHSDKELDPVNHPPANNSLASYFLSPKGRTRILGKYTLERTIRSIHRLTGKTINIHVLFNHQKTNSQLRIECWEDDEATSEAGGEKGSSPSSTSPGGKNRQQIVLSYIYPFSCTHHQHDDNDVYNIDYSIDPRLSYNVYVDPLKLETAVNPKTRCLSHLVQFDYHPVGLCIFPFLFVPFHRLEKRVFWLFNAYPSYILEQTGNVLQDKDLEPSKSRDDIVKRLRNPGSARSSRDNSPTLTPLKPEEVHGKTVNQIMSSLARSPMFDTTSSLCNHCSNVCFRFWRESIIPVKFVDIYDPTREPVPHQEVRHDSSHLIKHEDGTQQQSSDCHTLVKHDPHACKLSREASNVICTGNHAHSMHEISLFELNEPCFKPPSTRGSRSSSCATNPSSFIPSPIPSLDTSNASRAASVSASAMTNYTSIDEEDEILPPPVLGSTSSKTSEVVTHDPLNPNVKVSLMMDELELPKSFEESSSTTPDKPYSKCEGGDCNCGCRLHMSVEDPLISRPVEEGMATVASVVPFPMLLTLASLYFRRRIQQPLANTTPESADPKGGFNAYKLLSNETFERLHKADTTKFAQPHGNQQETRYDMLLRLQLATGSVEWLLQQLNTPVTYSSTVILFDEAMINQIYNQNTVPDAYIESDEEMVSDDDCDGCSSDFYHNGETMCVVQRHQEDQKRYSEYQHQHDHQNSSIESKPESTAGYLTPQQQRQVKPETTPKPYELPKDPAPLNSLAVAAVNARHDDAASRGSNEEHLAESSTDHQSTIPSGSDTPSHGSSAHGRHHHHGHGHSSTESGKASLNPKKSIFPYVITRATLPAWRALQYHLRVLDPEHLMCVYRHAGMMRLCPETAEPPNKVPVRRVLPTRKTNKRFRSSSYQEDSGDADSYSNVALPHEMYPPEHHASTPTSRRGKHGSRVNQDYMFDETASTSTTEPRSTRKRTSKSLANQASPLSNQGVIETPYSTVEADINHSFQGKGVEPVTAGGDAAGGIASDALSEQPPLDHTFLQHLPPAVQHQLISIHNERGLISRQIRHHRTELDLLEGRLRELDGQQQTIESQFRLNMPSDGFPMGGATNLPAPVTQQYPPLHQSQHQPHSALHGRSYYGVNGVKSSSVHNQTLTGLRVQSAAAPELAEHDGGQLMQQHYSVPAIGGTSALPPFKRAISSAAHGQMHSQQPQQIVLSQYQSQLHQQHQPQSMPLADNHQQHQNQSTFSAFPTSFNSKIAGLMSASNNNTLPSTNGQPNATTYPNTGSYPTSATMNVLRFNSQQQQQQQLQQQPQSQQQPSLLGGNQPSASQFRPLTQMNFQKFQPQPQPQGFSAATLTQPQQQQQPHNLLPSILTKQGPTTMPYGYQSQIPAGTYPQQSFQFQSHQNIGNNNTHSK